jgi:hypothetical protein
MVERLFGSLHDCMALQRAHYTGENPSPWTRQALFDCWAIQLRHAMHFILGTGAQPTDIIAADYFAAGFWRELLEGSEAEDWPAMLDKATLDDWIDAEIMHLRYERIHAPSETRNWPQVLVTSHVGRDLEAFVDNVAPELVSDDFAVRAQNALDSLR